MRRTTYGISRSDRGDWTLTVQHPSQMTPFPKPTLLGRYGTRKAAVTAARLLAGRGADVIVFPA